MGLKVSHHQFYLSFLILGGQRVLLSARNTPFGENYINILWYWFGPIMTDEYL